MSTYDKIIHLYDTTEVDEGKSLVNPPKITILLRFRDDKGKNLYRGLMDTFLTGRHIWISMLRTRRRIHLQIKMFDHPLTKGYTYPV